MSIEYDIILGTLVYKDDKKESDSSPISSYSYKSKDSDTKKPKAKKKMTSTTFDKIVYSFYFVCLFICLILLVRAWLLPDTYYISHVF